MSERTDKLSFINLDAYPIHQKGSALLQKVIANAHRELASDGCFVLRNFLTNDGLNYFHSESASLADQAYFKTEIVNAYNSNPDDILPEAHPAHIKMSRGNGFVTYDQIPEMYKISTLYKHSHFQDFVAAIFKKDQIYPLADPLAALCINVLRPGKEHPWHFDTNEFTVSMVTKKAPQGGEFEYCPNIRTPEKESLGDVREAITNHGAGHSKILNLSPGDLQFFTGRYSLHRVREVGGDENRLSVIFAYAPVPDVIGTAERARQIFGRALPEHTEADKSRHRADGLLD